MWETMEDGYAERAISTRSPYWIVTETLLSDPIPLSNTWKEVGYLCDLLTGHSKLQLFQYIMINTYKDGKRLITLIFDTRAPKTDTHTGVEVRGQPNPLLPTANQLTGAWGGTRQKTNPMPANAASSSADA